MNKKAQQDLGEVIKLIFMLVVILPILGAMFSMINSLNPKCPVCDCSPYQTSLNNCTSIVNNLTVQLNQTPIRYIENITYIEVPVEKEIIVYKEKYVPLTINLLALIFSITITIKLFKINLPKELEEKLKRIEKAIIFVKWGSLFVSLLILIRLGYIFFYLL